MRNFKNVLTVALFMMGAVVFAQTQLSGKVVDDSGQPLPGADVLVVGTTQGTSSDFDGNFTFETTKSSGTISIGFMGFETQKLAFNGSKNFGTVKLAASSESLDEVIVIGAGVIDLAKDRKTPIAVSTIGASEIKEKVGNFDLPELLTNTPSIQSVKRGGYGDGQMYLRGFDQTNTAFLLNGQPINGMEDGKMYWSNWSGVLDIANAVQVQRGLGSSKLAISSVGGTVNIVTKTVDKKQGGFVTGMMGNDNYYKGAMYYSTGIMENGLAVGAMLGHWQGDGYRNGTAGQGQTYYLSFGYKPNDNNIFNLMITGAPQWHGDAWTVDLDTYLTNPEGGKYNKYYGYKEGELYSGLRNFYHKPIVNLSWDWNISSISKLSTVAYGSIGRGGYAYMEGAAWGLTNDEDGGMDFDALIAMNTDSDGNPADAAGYIKGSFNGHNWFGMVTNFETEINENITFNIGGDVRLYNGIHFRAPVDLMGAKGYNNSNNFSGDYYVDNVYGGFNPWEAVTNFNDDHKQRFSYDYEENINYFGVFAQLEYSKDNFATFFQGSVSQQNHLATNFYNYDVAKESDKISNLGYNAKAGISYKINEGNTTYFNGGYYSRQPFHDDLYDNLRYSVDLNPLAGENQSVIGLELGHSLKINKFKMDINLYQTSWANRTTLNSRTDDSDPLDIKRYNFQHNGVNQIHKGVELDFSFRPIETLQILGFGSLGDWKFGEEATTKVYDENTGEDITSTYTGPIYGKYEEGDMIGGASQFTAGLGVKWEMLKDLKFDLTQKYNDKLYSLGGDFRLPSYSLIDAGVSYKLRLKDKSIDFRFNVNNLADQFYIEFSGDRKLVTEDTNNANVWNGINTANNVSIGYGRTWNFSTRFNF
ncbi:MAG TPA: TonB-dependent receptor [Lutibacter sp.]|nr:TonB-dependent receptor [Lutibacter sp.]